MKHPCKGTVFQLEIATVFTTVGQMVSIDVGENAPETFESHTLDQTEADKHKDPTGYVAGGDVSGELFFDPFLAAHEFLYELSVAPVKTDYKVKLSDHASAPSTLDGIASAVRVGVAVKMNDGLKAKFTVEQDGPARLTPRIA